MCSLNGGTLGTVITWPMAGYLMQYFGWSTAFYVPAIITVFLTILWYAVVYNSPAVHPRILHAERELIEKSLESGTKPNVKFRMVRKWLQGMIIEIVLCPQRKCPPISCLLKSLPLWSLLFLHYGCMWAIYLLMIGAPKYMNEVLNYHLSKAGVLASLPYLARFVSSFVFGALADSFLKNEILSKSAIRKSFCIFCT